MNRRRTLSRALALTPWMLPALRGASAQERGYPNRTITMVVGFPPGQASDIGARAVAAKMTELMDQKVVVDNKPGATGIIAHQFVKNAKPDGYTVLFGSSGTLAINPGLYRKLPYDPIKDFIPVVMLNSSPMYLFTAVDNPVNNYKEMVAYVKSRPGQVSYGSGGSGTTQHIAIEMLKTEAGMDMQHVPYKGSPAMTLDVIAGRVQFAFDTASSLLPHAQAGRVKLLGVSSLERNPPTPNVMTIAEQGLPGFEALTWAGLLVPIGTPAAVVDTLNAGVNRALKTPEVIEHYTRTGSNVKGGTSAAFASFMKQEIAKWGKAVIASGAQVD